MKPSKTKRNHYWMAAGEVVFIHVDLVDQQPPGKIQMNAIIKNDVNFINRDKLGEAQTSMQSRFFGNIQENEPESMDKVKVIDVFLFATSYMGYMTDAEFLGSLPAANTNEPKSEPKPLDELLDQPGENPFK